MPPACEAVLRTVGGAGGGDYHHPNEMNENGFKTAGVVSLWLGHVRVLTYHRYVIHYPHAASLPPPYAFTLNITNKMEIFPINQTL